MSDKLRALAKELAEGIADKANECCYRMDGYEENIAALAEAAILHGMREALRPDDESALYKASMAVRLMLLREGSSWGTKACEEMGRVFMVEYRRARGLE